MAIDGKATGVISVGDKGDVFQVATNEDLSGSDKWEIWIDHRNDATGVFTSVIKLTAAIDGLPSAGNLEATTSKTTSPFTLEGWHEGRSYVEWSDGQSKFGDPFEFYVHRGS